MGWVGGGGLVEGYLSRVFGLWAFWVPLRVFLKKNLNETNQLLQRLSFSFSCLCCLVLLVLFRKMISFQFSVALLVTVRFVRFRFWNTQKFVLQSVQTSTWIQIHFSVLYFLCSFSCSNFCTTPPHPYLVGLGFSWRPPSLALDWNFAIYLLDVQSNFGDILSSSTFRRYVYNERHLEGISHDGGS